MNSRVMVGLIGGAVAVAIGLWFVLDDDPTDDGGSLTEAVADSSTTVPESEAAADTTVPVLDVQTSVVPADSADLSTGDSTDPSTGTSADADPTSSTTVASTADPTGTSAAPATSGGAAATGETTNGATSVTTPPTSTPPASTAAPINREAAQPGDPNDAYFGGGSPNCSIFPADNWWNRPVDDLPVHPQSNAWVSGIGSGNLHPVFGTIWQGNAIGIPYRIVNGDQPRVPVSFVYGSESDPGPYPIPADAPIEDLTDRHVIIVDDTNCRLYELFDAAPNPDGSGWSAVSGAVFDLRSNELRPDRWTSADAAGLPIFPGLVTYDEVVVEGRIDHALRFTAARTQRAYIRPATHWASSITDPGVAPMGARFRLRSDHDCSGYSREVQVVCAALKTYGMFLADNGSDWHVVGSPDPRWDDSALRDLRNIPGSAFEVVDTGEPLTR